jgi:hypothetical protein
LIDHFIDVYIQKNMTINAPAFLLGTHSKFTYVKGNSRRMYWKMSVDLSRPQVPSMGHHDALDGYVTYYHILQAKPATEALVSSLVDISVELKGILTGQDWVTNDSLGLGGLLMDAFKVGQILVRDEVKMKEGTDILNQILKSCCKGLKDFGSRSRLDAPARFRLAFREEGLAIGLALMPALQALVRDKDLEIDLEAVNTLVDMGAISSLIMKFWNDPENRKAKTWKEHCDINTVMLATALAPMGYADSMPLKK